MIERGLRKIARPFADFPGHGKPQFLIGENIVFRDAHEVISQVFVGLHGDLRQRSAVRPQGVRVKRAFAPHWFPRFFVRFFHGRHR